MLYGLIPPELYAQLLDHENFQNRTNGIEELKNIISELDLHTVYSDSIVEFIQFLHRLLDDTNFKVLCGTLQVINLLIQKLDYNVHRYYKQIVYVALKTLGDTRTVPRNEYMDVFRQVMRIVGPQKILELVIGHLKNKNSRVREDVINIITAAMLTHPRKDFSIPELCFAVAPYLADSKKRVRHAALELFAVFDYCLDTGKKQPLIKAINMVELTEDMEGLMAAVQARRARHILPRLSPDGMVEYALVIPKPGQRHRPQLGSGADLDLILNGGRVNSARSLQRELDSGGLSGNCSLSSLTDDIPLRRRIVSAGKGKNKLPWERSSLPCPVNLQLSSASSGTTPHKSNIEDLTTYLTQKQKACVTQIGSAEPLQPHSPGTLGSLRRSGSLDLDQDIFKAARNRDAERGLPKPSSLLSGSPSVEPTVSIPSHSTLLGSFLLPTYPLASLSGVNLSPTHSRRRHADSSLSVSNTWPNSLDMNSHYSEPTTAKSSARTYPVTEQTVQDGSQLGRNLSLDLSLLSLQDPDDELFDKDEMVNSLRSLRNSAAKKRAKMSQDNSKPDPEIPDTAVKLEPTLDSPTHSSPSMTSPLSERSLSSLGSPPTPITNGTKTIPGAKTCIVSSGRLKTIFCQESQIHSARSFPADMSDGVVGHGIFSSILPPTQIGVQVCPEQKVHCKPPSRVCHGHAVSAAHDDSASPGMEESVERVRLSMFAREKMHQHYLNQQKAEPVRRDHMERIRHCLRHHVSEVSYNESAPQKDLQLNVSVAVLTKTEFSVNFHQPASSTQSNKMFQYTLSTQPPSKRATSMIRKCPSLSSSSDEFTTATPKSDLHEQLHPFSKPNFAFTQSFKLLKSDDWEKKIEGLAFLRSLARHHSDILISRLHDVCFILIKEVQNLRSGVSRMAVVTLGELYSGLQKGMDQELDSTVKALLQKAGESNAFIRQDVDAALDSMVQNCTPTRSMSALLNGGLGHLNAVVRKCTSQHLATLVEKIGAGRLLSGTKDLPDRILPAVAKLAQDPSQETRYFGRRMLLYLSFHSDFEKTIAKYIPDKDLVTIKDTVLTLKTKGLGEMPHDTPSARGRYSISGNGQVCSSSLSREPHLASIKRHSKAQIHSITDKTEYIKQLKALLGSKDFRERIKGIDQLVTDCKDNACIIMSNMFPVFDAFKSLLQESNSKVNLNALEALQKIITLLRDKLAQVVFILVPAIVDNHLNSKNDAIYMAANDAVQALINNLDNTLLLQPFCTKAQFLNGKAKVDLVDKVAEMVKELYPRKPQLVEQKVLPLLWNLLGTSSNSGVLRGRGGSVREATANLCQALHMHMGPALLDFSASQPSNIHKSLNDYLKNPQPQRSTRIYSQMTTTH